MLETPAYAASSIGAPLKPFVVQRREPGPHDVLVDIEYCGVCHSDIHQVRNEWGESRFPMVPGHEIVGKVARVGGSVKRWKTGQNVGVGVFVDSCRKCTQCLAGQEQYCEGPATYTYNSFEQDRKTPTFGGYSTRITVDEGYVLNIPDEIPPEKAAPLLCAGITTYSPLRYFGVKEGSKVGVVGLGGLGHMGVKFAKAMGAEVTVLSHSPSKEADAKRLGASNFIPTNDPSFVSSNMYHFDFILDTVSAPHRYDDYLTILRVDGTMMLVGLPDPSMIRAQSLVDKRRRLVGSSVGSIKDTQEMLDFSAAHGVGADVEIIDIKRVDEAFDRTVKGDVRYRFVIDVESIRNES